MKNKNKNKKEKIKIDKNFILRIFSYFKPYKYKLIISVITILIASVVGLVPPMILQKIMDVALPNKDLSLLITFVALSIFAIVAVNLLEVLQSYINMNISQEIIYDMKNDMYEHLQYMSTNFYSTEKPGEIITRISSDIDGVQGVFNSTFVNLLDSSFMLIVTLIALFSMNVKLALIGIVTLPLFVISTKKVAKVRWSIAKERQDSLANLNQLIQETLSISGSTLMKLFATEDKEYEKFEQSNRSVVDLQIKESIAGRWMQFTVHTLVESGPLLIYLAGGYLYFKGEISIGMIFTFSALLSRLYRPILKISDIHVDIIRSFALFERIFDYFDLEHDIKDSKDAINLEVKNGKIEFENVSFNYSDDKEILKNISFKVADGSQTALVGSSGAGKTTITNLITRLYDTSKGEIKIDGININLVTLKSLRKNIGVVTQEPYLFNATIKDNLLYGTENISEDQMFEAAKSAYIHDYIMSLPNGYNTIVGNRGIRLSGGQKQRISIARVILNNPKILILDEATSALDSISESYVQKAMKSLLKNRTSIVIAHRLSTIKESDQILVIEEGRIIEQGNHDSLMDARGAYYKLNQKDFDSDFDLIKSYA